MSIPCKFATAAEARKANWFSRRHRTSDEHRDEVIKRRNKEQAQFQNLQIRLERQVEWAAQKAARLAAKQKAKS